ncbi:MAG: GDSL-type esterase/lipase family protein, partial [Chitinophagaceae bacterium]
QQPPFWNDIQAFQKKDSIKMPQTNQVLFIGSSSFTMWTDIQNYFPAIPIINRGFGGSSISDLLMYKEEVIFKYRPKQIVIYCGENDFAASDTVSVETVVLRFKELFTAIRSRYKKIHIAYVSMKPSPSRQQLMPKFVSANTKIKLFLKQYRNTAFIDVYHKMLKPGDTPMTDIFLDDNLHMNAKGYTIWQKAIAPYLVKN